MLGSRGRVWKGRRECVCLGWLVMEGLKVRACVYVCVGERKGENGLCVLCVVWEGGWKGV